jgi:WD40 repeat protein
MRLYITMVLAATFALPFAIATQFKSKSIAAIDTPQNFSQTTNRFKDPQLIYTFNGHSGTVKSLAFTPDSKILASGGSQNDGRIGLWNTLTGKKVAIISRAHKTSVESLLISPNGQTLVSCSNDNTINLWNLSNSKFTRSFVGHSSSVLSIAVTPDSKVLISGALDGIRMWDLLQQRPLATLVRFDNVHTVAISPDGQILASGDHKGVIKLWDLTTGKLIRTFVAHTDTVTALAFTSNGQIVSASRDRNLKLWNISTELVRTFTGHNNAVNAIAIHPDGVTVASAGRDGIKLWDLTTGELRNTLYGHSDWVSAIAFSPDGQTLASGGYDKKVKIWRSQ